MNRPKMNDALICRVAADEWVEHNYDHLLSESYFHSEQGAESFANTLAEAARCGYLDAHALARNARIQTNDDIIEDLESFSAHHHSVYDRTVKQWMRAWAPTRPFTGEYSRIVVKTSDGEISGIGQINSYTEDTGKLYLYTDANKNNPKIMSHRSGLFSTALILNWEEVVSAQSLSDSDDALISEYKANLIRFEEDAKAYAAFNDAKQQLSSDVKKHRGLTVDEAIAIFNDLNVNETDIPKLISALNKVGIQKRIQKNAISNDQLSRLI